jgi:hypothetical protein
MLAGGAAQSASPVRRQDASVDRRTLLSIASEARSLGDRSEPATIARFYVHDDGSLRGKRRVNVATGGTALHTIHHGVGLALARDLLASVDAAQVYPTRACYLYYAAGDYALLHHDVTQCTATLLLPVLGEPAPLVLYPNFGTPRNSDIIALNEAPVSSQSAFEKSLSRRLDEARLRSRVLTLPEGRLVGQTGRDVPHARYPQTDAVVLAAFCYAALVHRPPWLNRAVV